MPRCRWTITTSALCLLFCTAAAQDSSEPDPLFASNEILEATLSAPFTSIMRDRPIDNEVRGLFQYSDTDGSTEELDVGIRTRGNFRRREDVCSFAPLRLNLKKSQIKDTLFHKQDKLKLVTHCQSNSPRYDQTIIAEYLAYRILSLLSDTSFRVRLLRINYVDTDNPNKELVRIAVLIEHRDRLAKRIGIPVLNVRTISEAALEPAYTNLVSVFQYLIGNTDFSMLNSEPGDDCCHNQNLFGEDGQLYYSVPYDFDMSGIVNARHAGPNPRFKLRSVRQRLYRGRCLNNGYLPATLDHFRDERNEIYALLREQSGLTPSTRKSVLSYIDKFYKTIDNPKNLKSQFIKECI